MTAAVAEPRALDDGRNATATTTTVRRRARRVPVAAASWTVAVAGVASLITACVMLSPRKWMWYDEVLTSLLVNDPSWRHMMTAITTGIEAAPPLYHFLARAWIALFGGTPLSLRVFTVTGLSAALLVVWSTLSRVFPWRAVAIGVLAVFCGSSLFFDQIAEVRYYGLLAALVAVALMLCHRVMISSAPTGRLLVSNGVVQALLVLSHVYGGLYSGAFLLALLVWDIVRGVIAPRRWIAYPIGWLALVPWLPVFQTQRGAMARSWIPIPNLGDLRDAYRFQMSTEVVPFALLAAVLLAAAASALDAAPGRAVESDSARSNVSAAGRGALVVIAAGLLTVPMMSFVVSHLIVPIFYPRYLIGAAYAPAILITYVVTVVLERRATAVDGPVSAPCCGSPDRWSPWVGSSPSSFCSSGPSPERVSGRGSATRESRSSVCALTVRRRRLCRSWSRARSTTCPSWPTPRCPSPPTRSCSIQRWRLRQTAITVRCSATRS